MQTAEQQARDLLERMGIRGAQGLPSTDLVELANLMAAAPISPDAGWAQVGTVEFDPPDPLDPGHLGLLVEATPRDGCVHDVLSFRCTVERVKGQGGRLVYRCWMCGSTRG